MAVRLALDSWRWAGVPILIRAGKAMPVTATEVTIRFNRPPHDIFGVHDASITNALRFRIWPEARTTLSLAGKKPGAGRIPQLQELSFAEEPGSDMRPYDRLIEAALDGTGCRSPARTQSRPPGGSSTRCSAMRSRSASTPAAAGVPKRPTPCFPTAPPGTTRPTDPRHRYVYRHPCRVMPRPYGR